MQLHIPPETNFTNSELLNAPQARPETAEENEKRVFAFLVWQLENKKERNFEVLGRILPIPVTGVEVQRRIKARRIRPELHNDFIAIGVPENVLPPAQIVPVGRPAKDRQGSAA